MTSLKRMFRSWVRNKLFVFEILAILAVGLGANIAVFSIFNSAFLQLPVQEPDRVLVLNETRSAFGGDGFFVSIPDFEDWGVDDSLFEETGVYDSENGVVSAGGIPERVTVATASANLLSLLGVHPEYGSLLSSSQESDTALEALVSDRLWRTLLHGNRDAIGGAIRVGDNVYTVRGVLPDDFKLFDNADIWIRLQHTTGEPRGGRHFIALARLKPGRTLKEARAKLQAVSQRLQNLYPDTNDGWEASAMTIREYLFQNLKTSFELLFTTALVVLMVAIFNVANLFGVYLQATQKDQALELALGSSAARVRNRLLGEFLLLAFLAGVLGLAVAYVMLKLVLRYAPPTLVGARHPLDVTVYCFAFAAALLSGLFATLVTFASHSRMSVSDVLKGTTREFGGKLGFGSFRRLLFLVFEVAMCVVLLTTAGILSKSFSLLQHVNPGFDPRGILTAKIELPDQFGAAQQILFWDRLLNDVSHFPGVSGVASMTGIPLGGSRMTFRFAPEGAATSEAPQFAEYRAISPGLFGVLGISVHRGRPFLESDDRDSTLVAVINEALARSVFPGQDPIGKRLVLWYGDKKPREIVGVVADVKLFDLTDKITDEVYVPYKQNPWPFMTLLLHTTVSPTSFTPLLRQEVLKFDNDLPIEDIRTMEQVVYVSKARSRFASVLILCFAALALVLAASGLYGVISFAAFQRSREIAIRIALGATRYSVLKLFLFQGLAVLAMGNLLGLPSSFFSIRFFQALLYKVHPFDPEVAFVVTCIIVIVGMGACLAPASRAASVEPAVVMRGH